MCGVKSSPVYEKWTGVEKNRMKMEQLSVFLENKSGSLVEVTSALNEEGVKLIATIVTDTTEFGVLRMIVDDPEKGRKILRDQGFSCRISDVVALLVDDKDGFVSVLQNLSGSGLNIEYLYTFLQSPSGKTWMAFRCNDTEKAVDIIRNLPGVQAAEPPA